MDRLSSYRADTLLTDGSIAVIRTVLPDDRDDLSRLFSEASDTNFHRRFFSLNRDLATSFVDQICLPGRSGDDLVARLDGQLVAVASVDEISSSAAEISVFVADGEHSHGLGTLLIEHVAALQRARAVKTLTADVLADNAAMLRVFESAGFEVATERDSSVVQVVLRTELSPSAIDSAGHRERLAERASLRPLLEPRSVAVVGVSRHAGIGRAVIERIRHGGYTGRLYAVNPKPMKLDGIQSVTEIAEIEQPVDLVVVAVPAAHVNRVLEQSADLGVRAAVVVTSGFAELGEDGLTAQLQLRATARRAGMRLVGPNCFGVVSNLHETRLDATFCRQTTEPGRLAIASQSGGVGIAVLDELVRRSVGVAAFVSLGNKADVSGNDLLCAWTEDPAVDVVALYLESFGNPHKFLSVARACSRSKPVIAQFGGQSAAGQRAGVSHTAGSLTSDRFLRALCESTGVIPVTSTRELVDIAALLLDQPVPAGRRLGIVGNAGGLGVLAADAAERAGLTVAPVSQLKEESKVLANPLDLGADANVSTFGSSVQEMVRSDQVDSLLVILAATTVTDMEAIVAAVSEATQTDHRRITCCLVVVGAPAPSSTLTPFDGVSDAVTAIAAAADYGQWRQLASTDLPRRVNQHVTALGPRMRELLDDAGGATTLGPVETLEFLQLLGLPAPAWRLVRSTSEVAAAVSAVELPVVAKSAQAGLVHKTDLGLVVRDLGDVDAVTTAVRLLHQRTGGDGAVLLQEQVLPGVELALGIVHEPHAGPLLMISTGGVGIELWADQVFLVPPVSRDRVLGALHSLRSWPRLVGFRGQPPADVDAFVRLAMIVSDLAVDAPEVHELDLNPVIVGPHWVSCVDATIVLQDAPTVLDGAPSLSGQLLTQQSETSSS